MKSPSRRILASLIGIAGMGLTAHRGDAAVVVTDGRILTWHFTLEPRGASSDSLDQFHLVFGDDRLSDTDLVSVNVFPAGQSVPVICLTWSGSPNGTGSFTFLRDLNDAFPAMEGVVSFDVLKGSVDLEGITFLIRTRTRLLGANMRQPMHLVPEPSSCLLLGMAGLVLGFRRRRRALV
ncbi:PEP-CTERM sorting domain-containing protein [Luteolibacter luteus]|uniref:PEP-CTERM sorting domain-containing protein n=1 Tax=Luteolibacter luteus TaxID=2728835 RepID=A0A858RS96_9BACT|nr:PEP-CTERM sorting domain-containing protein [Luteolibacter luteus]QJE99040.1 PEP-CTERM sorting domain-containing protein [Luteolibacter luteus]